MTIKSSTSCQPTFGFVPLDQLPVISDEVWICRLNRSGDEDEDDDDDDDDDDDNVGFLLYSLNIHRFLSSNKRKNYRKIKNQKPKKKNDG